MTFGIDIHVQGEKPYKKNQLYSDLTKYKNKLDNIWEITISNGQFL